MRGMYVLLKRRNMRLMKDNPRLYRMIKMLRLQKNHPNSKIDLALETLAEATVSLEYPEVSQDVADIPNIMQVEEVPEG